MEILEPQDDIYDDDFSEPTKLELDSVGDEGFENLDITEEEIDDILERDLGLA